MDYTKKLINNAFLIVKKLRKRGFIAYYAGGIVRDMIFLNNSIKDIDIVTSALPSEVCNIFSNGIIVGNSFGIVIVLINGIKYEIATFRTDKEYTDNRRPSIFKFTNEVEDSKRRDFTINGMFYDPILNKTIDYINGKNDIKNKTIRCIGDPFTRFTEDYLRILRAIRFSSSLNFSIENNTWKFIIKLAHKVVFISKERVIDELYKMICSNSSSVRAFKILHKSGIICFIVPLFNSLYFSNNFFNIFLNRINSILKHTNNLNIILSSLLYYIYSNLNSNIIFIYPFIFKLSLRDNKEINYILMNLYKVNLYYRFCNFKKKELNSNKLLFSIILIYKRYFGKIIPQGIKYIDIDSSLQKITHKLVSGRDIIMLSGLKPGPVINNIITNIHMLYTNNRLKTKQSINQYIINYTDLYQ